MHERSQPGPEAGESGTPTRYEVGAIFREYGAAYRRTHRLPSHHRRVMRDLEQCRTAALGGHVDECDHCGAVRISYNSCRNRHCPKCQGAARAKWVAAREAQLLPIEYFHVVFTVPEALHELVRFNQRRVLNLLFRCAAETLLEFGQRHLGGELGITAVLHTWGQTLCEHPHLHCVVTGGALAKDGSRFQTCAPGYLFPVKALSQVFRAKFCRALEREYARGALHPEAPACVRSAVSFQAYLQSLARQAWVVHAKRPFAGPEVVIRYLGRYTHRVAISNSRLVAVVDGQVSFSYKDYRDEERQRVLTVSAEEFIRRFLLHVLPPEFVRIRHYGLHANGRREKLDRSRELLGVRGDEPRPPEHPATESQAHDEARICPACGRGRLVRRLELEPAAGGARYRGEREGGGLNPHRGPPR